jgi:hypothetical protein
MLLKFYPPLSYFIVFRLFREKDNVEATVYATGQAGVYTYRLFDLICTLIALHE